ncbi:RimK/LysX family protein [Aestuariicella sp. G3-2]|uniref:ATP-dependent zinc protease family protein n=1 Tax=Pseudomaricurvus albidus TaxID=2842452 RepID=UPI001C0E3918|nr:RimK/LysX family protein [Aestuariicella albida]MBU3070479.1 RimK/LysX family protein [Aestuariicella albida]
MQKVIRSWLSLFTLLSCTGVMAAASKEATEEPLLTLGWVEHAHLIEPNYPLKAKLDTGAKTSSLDARIIKAFRQYGKRWVRFAVQNPKTGEETILVRERVRTIGIVQHEGESEVRPTVNIEICLAGQHRDIEVSLVDRENFTYPLLLGRRALKHIAIVHPGETFMSDQSCENVTEETKSSPKPSSKESPGEEDDKEQTIDETEAAGENEKSGNAEERSDKQLDNPA